MEDFVLQVRLRTMSSKTKKEGIAMKRVVYVAMVLVVVFPLWGGRLIQVPEEYQYIKDAVLVASDNDTISVQSGTVENPRYYYEQINFMGKDLLIAAREVGATDPRQIDNPDPKTKMIGVIDVILV